MQDEEFWKKQCSECCRFVGSKEFQEHDAPAMIKESKKQLVALNKRIIRKVKRIAGRVNGKCVQGKNEDVEKMWLWVTWKE